MNSSACRKPSACWTNTTDFEGLIVLIDTVTRDAMAKLFAVALRDDPAIQQTQARLTSMAAATERLTMAANENASFDQWAIVELMGHQVIAGRVTEMLIGGTVFLRVDVPEVPPRPIGGGTGGQPAFSRLLSASAIYAINPVDEETCRAYVQSRPPSPPLDVYNARQLVAMQLEGPGAGHPAPPDDDDFPEDRDDDDIPY